MMTDYLLQRLRGLLEAQFDELLFRMQVPREYLPSSAAPLVTRAIELIRYLENQNRLRELDRTVTMIIANDITTSRDIEIKEWHTYLESLQRQVCRIEIQGTRTGTAFLVKPDIILTAFTAVQRLFDGTAAPSEVSFRFDLWPLEDGQVCTGIVYRLAEVDWVVDRSPPEHLNFAVLRLSDLPRGGERLGAVALRSGGRGYIPLPDVTRPLSVGATLFLVHHPGEGVIRLSMDCYAVKRLTRDGCRFLHAIATDGGSVGAPFFDTTGALVAIHEGAGGASNRTSIVWNAVLGHHHPYRWK